MKRPPIRVLGLGLGLALLLSACQPAAEQKPVFVITFFASRTTNIMAGRGSGGYTGVQDDGETAGLQFALDESDLIESDWPNRRLVFDRFRVDALDPPYWIYSPGTEFSATFKGDTWAEGVVIPGISAAVHEDPVLFILDGFSQDGRLEMLFLDMYGAPRSLDSVRLSSIPPDLDSAIGEFLKGLGTGSQP